MDTKLKVKDKTRFIIFLVISLCLALGIGYGLYYLTDVVFNGSVLNWLAENYYYMETRHDKATGEISYYYLPIWPKLKLLILTLFLFQTAFFVLTIYIATHLYARVRVRKSISNTGRMLHTYMHHDLDSNDVFPSAYAEVATQIVQIKSTMQRHEQAMKAETDRKIGRAHV